MNWRVWSAALCQTFRQYYEVVLLHHKFCLLCREALLPQQGHRGRFLMRALIKRMRMVAIEFGMWRSGRKGGSPGSIAVG
jgi:hypothetical protein